MVDIDLDKSVDDEDGTFAASKTFHDLPILPLRNVVVYPHMVVPITVGQARSLRLVDSAAIGERMLGLVTMKDPNVDEPGPDLLYKIGTYARIIKLIKAPDGTVRMIVQGVERIEIDEWTTEEPFLKAHVHTLPDELPAADDAEAEAMRRHLLELFSRLVAVGTRLPNEVATAASQSEDIRHLVYLIASSVQMDLNQSQELLEIHDLKEKMRQLQAMMTREFEVLELGKKIQSEARSEIDKTQRDYLLREQLKAIKKELGESDEQQIKLEEYRAKIEEIGMPEEAKREALRELGRLEKLPEAAAEYGVIQTYLDWLTSLPWSKTTTDVLDLARAKDILDEDHFDLEKIKERLLEFLAVRKLKTERAKEAPPTEDKDDFIRREREGVILCFVGPPGVGKTSLGQSIARAIGRKFIRISLGGVRDEAEIRGHRRTYIGAMPGRFIQTIRRVNSKNPVIMLDEVDKLSHDWRGDPSSALLEVLDPEQNREFRDHYLDVPFDLSEVMFIATANVVDSIPQPLLDRMEVIHLSGYTDHEKLHIAHGFLIPRQIKENGLKPDEIEFDDEALRTIIGNYTREAGVRSLERQIGTVCRKVAVEVAKGQTAKTVVGNEQVPNYLGKQRFFSEIAERTASAGVATGLAYTAAGGDILFIEATRMTGKKGLTITGQLGDVMKESAQAALSYVRSKADSLQIADDFFETSDIHIHVPAGAVPKDGPSAGVTMATALTSLLTGRTVRTHLGMTGEITLRGKVLPVGGIKEKVLAAHRAGLTTIILPKRNEKDLDDLLPEVRDAMQFILVEHVSEVLEHALSPEAVTSEIP